MNLSQKIVHGMGKKTGKEKLLGVAVSEEGHTGCLLGYERTRLY